MTPEVQLALVAAIVPTIAAVGAIVVVIVGNRRVTTKADVIVAKVDDVKAATNGHLTSLTKSLEVATEKVSGLEKMVAALTVELNKKPNGKS